MHWDLPLVIKKSVGHVGLLLPLLLIPELVSPFDKGFVKTPESGMCHSPSPCLRWSVIRRKALCPIRVLQNQSGLVRLSRRAVAAHSQNNQQRKQDTFPCSWCDKEAVTYREASPLWAGDNVAIGICQPGSLSIVVHEQLQTVVPCTWENLLPTQIPSKGITNTIIQYFGALYYLNLCIFV